MAKITKEFYPKSIVDDFDYSAKDISKTPFKKKVKFGKNVLIGKNVKIGKNCLIGHNTIIEKNVIIGSNCSIGSNTIIRNTIINDNVSILDGCVTVSYTHLRAHETDSYLVCRLLLDKSNSFSSTKFC